MIPSVGQKLLNGIHRKKFDKLQFKVWKFQAIHCDDGAGKKQKCSKSSMLLAGPIVQYILMNFKQGLHMGNLLNICAVCAE
jgi:hypothetical protein